MLFNLVSITRAIGLSSALATLASPVSAAGPFADFAGTWSGTGSVTSTDGAQEAIRCKATYAVKSGGDALDIVSDVVAQDGTLSGSWQETTRQIQGDVTGRIPSPDTFQASLRTPGGGLQLGARTNGKQQAITITSQGSDIRGANITLRRS